MEPTNPTPDNKTFSTGLTAAMLLVWDFLKIILVAVIIIIPIRYFVFQPFVVSGASMEPTFENGEYLVIDELTYHFSDPQRGQVVVMHYPKDPKQYFIKRVIGLPGEKIEIDNGKVTIFNTEHPNGQVLDEPYLSSQSFSYPHDAEVVGGRKVLTLGKDEYFMMGDNRLASSDSRDWGPLKRSDMVGKVFLRALPLNEFEVFAKTPEYSF